MYKHPAFNKTVWYKPNVHAQQVGTIVFQTLIIGILMLS